MTGREKEKENEKRRERILKPQARSARGVPRLLERRREVAKRRFFSLLFVSSCFRFKVRVIASVSFLYCMTLYVSLLNNKIKGNRRITKEIEKKYYVQ